MDRHLKERMVGAVILIAIAVILIPEMYSDPRSTPSSEAGTPQLPSGEDATKLKTYTIDLSKAAPGAAPSEPAQAAMPTEPTRLPAAETPISTTAPPPEDPPAQSPSTTPSSPQRQAANQPAGKEKDAVKPEDTKQVAAAPARNDSPKSAPPKTEPPKADPPKADSARAEPQKSGWTVQVGSFGVRATSDRIAADLKREGFSAFVVAFANGNQTMYRVRVGPEKDRAAAEALLRKLKAQHPNATLVAPT